MRREGDEKDEERGRRVKRSRDEKGWGREVRGMRREGGRERKGDEKGGG